jgi:cytochrome c biogenesis factor
MQVAVLLLAIGTILGAVWADEAWGRFWGWDPKEVWALISLLIYLAVLHGRYVGWIGHFGLAFGSVLGAASIVMAWYGVNFILRTGLHSYGSGGDSGKWWVVLVMVLNVIYALAALGRYLIETRLFDPGVVQTASAGTSGSATRQ